jgi:hypothetical protein
MMKKDRMKGLSGIYRHSLPYLTPSPSPVPGEGDWWREFVREDGGLWRRKKDGNNPVPTVYSEYRTSLDSCPYG